MAVSATRPLDTAALRADFAFLEELVSGKPLAYLDSASSTQKPRQVLDRMRSFYEHEYANVHRGVYRLAERATEGYEAARRTVAGFVNARAPREVVFTRSATEALNLVAYAWGFSPSSLPLRLERLVKKTKPRSSWPLRSTIRTEGIPALDAVASAICSGAATPPARASANQRSNWTCGSRSRSSGSTPGRVSRRSARLD